MSNYQSAYLYKLTINNGTICLGTAVRYFAYTCLDSKSESAIIGRLWKCEARDSETYEHLLPYGGHYITHNDNKYYIYSQKVGEVQEALNMTNLYPCEVEIYLLQNDKYHKDLENFKEIKTEKADYFKGIVDNFITESKNFYDIYITEVEDKKGVVGIYIFDDYWELLNRHEPRGIKTVHLDGKEIELLEYINTFKNSSTKKRYQELGIPYKKNIMFEGYPGTGKTSLVFSLASELDCNIAIINFNRDMDDNNFMRAIRRLPKKCILVLDDIDALFKERKENDSSKSSLSFSALLNTLDGLAFRQGMVTIMTTNYLCNLDSALKRPGRIDKIVHFGLATKGQTKHMFHKFFPEKKEEFTDFYQEIRYCKYTTAILQQYFMWYMDDYSKIIENIEEFKELCSKHNYDNPLNLYS